MKRTLFVTFLTLIAGMAQAVSPTLRMGLITPTTGQFDYPTIIANNYGILDASACVQSQPNTFTSSNTYTGAGSSVTINQSLDLTYIPVGQCLTRTTNGITGQSCGGGGASTFAFFNGTANNPGTVISSPSIGGNFDSAYFTVQLKGNATGFVSLNTSNVTVQGNTFNGANELVQTDGSGHLPGSVVATGVIISTNILQTGATFYVSSGTVQSLQASSATIANQLQVNGQGLSGATVVGQINGSAFNVTAAGNIGLGTASPGFALDEQQGTANFAQGVVTSTTSTGQITMTSGGILFQNGTFQNTAAVPGAASVAFSSGSATNSTIVSSPTINVVVDSNTFILSLQGNASSFLQINPSSATLFGLNVIKLSNTLQVGSTFYVSSGTIAGNLTVSSITLTNAGLKNTMLATDASGNLISTSTTGGGNGTVNSGTAGNLGYYATSSNAISDSGVSSTAPTFTGVTTGLTFKATQSTNQMSFTGGGGGNQIRTLSVSPTTTVGETITVPDIGDSASTILSSGAQTLNGTVTLKSTVTVTSDKNAVYDVFVASNPAGMAGTSVHLSVSTNGLVNIGNGGLFVSSNTVLPGATFYANGHNQIGATQFTDPSGNSIYGNPVATASFSAQSTPGVSFGGYAEYVAVINVLNDAVTTQTLGLEFNADSGNNYAYSFNGFMVGSSTGAFCAHNTTDGIALSGINDIEASQSTYATCTLHIHQHGYTKIEGTCQYSENSTLNIVNLAVAGEYHSSSITSLRVFLGKFGGCGSFSSTPFAVDGSIQVYGVN